MKPEGKKKIRRTLEGHQDCGTCHPEQKNLSKRSRAAGKAEVARQIDDRYTDSKKPPKVE